MKVVSWDAENLNLVVQFASDDSLSRIDAVEPLCYQPITMFPDVDDVKTLIKKLAVSGINVCEMANLREKAKGNQSKIDEMNSLVGKTFEYSVEELLDLE